MYLEVLQRGSLVWSTIRYLQRELDQNAKLSYFEGFNDCHWNSRQTPSISLEFFANIPSLWADQIWIFPRWALVRAKVARPVTRSHSQSLTLARPRHDLVFHVEFTCEKKIFFNKKDNDYFNLFIFSLALSLSCSVHQHCDKS